MASCKAKFPVLQELFAKNHRGALAPPPPPPSGARVNKRSLPDMWLLEGVIFQLIPAASFNGVHFSGVTIILLRGGELGTGVGKSQSGGAR